MNKVFLKEYTSNRNTVLTLISFSVIVFLIFASRNEYKIFTADGFYLFLVVLLIWVISIILMILNSSIFSQEITTSISKLGTQKVADRHSMGRYLFIVLSNGKEQLEVTSEMYRALKQGDKVNLTYNVFTKKVEILEIL